MDGRIAVLRGDITELVVDAIVNAANTSLLGGGGVDGAIHRTAGPELLAHCRALGGCPAGQARLTPGFHLPTRHIIHTVGPVWHGGGEGEDDLLASCYGECLRIAQEKDLASIAFPAISTGIYGFPADRAAAIAVREIRRFLAGHDRPTQVVLVAYDEASLHCLNAALNHR